MPLLFLEQPCPRTTHRSPELSLCPIPLRLELPAWPSVKIPRIQIPPRTCINTRLKCRSKLRREVSRRKVIRCGGRSCDRGSAHLVPSAPESAAPHGSIGCLPAELVRVWGLAMLLTFSLQLLLQPSQGLGSHLTPTLARVISGTRSCVLAEAPSRRLRHLRVNTRDFE